MLPLLRNASSRAASSAFSHTGGQNKMAARALSLPNRLLTASLALLPFFALAVLYLITQLNLYHTRIESLLQVELEAKRLLQISSDAETAGRGYTLIPETELLRPLFQARRAMEETVDLSGVAPAQIVVDLEALAALSKMRVDQVESYVSRIDAGISEADRRDLLVQGRILQDNIRERTATLINAGRAQLQTFERSANVYIMLLVTAIGLTSFMAMALIFFWRRAVFKSTIIRAELERDYKSAFEDADIGIALLDTEGVIRSVNDSFLWLVGSGANQVIGQKVGRVIPQLQSAPPRDQTLVPHKRDGQQRFIRIFAPDANPQDRDAARLLIALDATSEIENAEALQRYETLLEQAGEIAGFAAWSFDPQTRSVRIGRAIAALLDLPAMAPVPLSRLSGSLRRRDLRILFRAAWRCLTDARRKVAATQSQSDRVQRSIAAGKHASAATVFPVRPGTTLSKLTVNPTRMKPVSKAHPSSSARLMLSGASATPRESAAC